MPRLPLKKTEYIRQRLEITVMLIFMNFYTATFSHFRPRYKPCVVSLKTRITYT